MIGQTKSWFDFITGKPTTREQYAIQSFLGGLSPIHNGIYSYRDNMAYMDDYMSNRGLSWDDIRYPYRTAGWSGGSALGHGVRSVSQNVARLYF